MIFAEKPYLLHLLCGSESEITALNAIKEMIDNGTHNVNELEPEDNLSPLHVAASWDNLAICQLLIHYGANINSIDIDKRRPIDVATGRSKRLLKSFKNKTKNDQNKFLKILTSLFHRFCVGMKVSDDSILVKNGLPMDRGSCPCINYSKTEYSACFNMNLILPAEVAESTNTVEAKPNQNNGINLSFSSSNAILHPFEGESKIVCSDEDDDDTPITTSTLEQVTLTPEEKELRKLFSKLKIGSLREKLKKKNLNFGPIDEKNRKYYEFKLARAELRPAKEMNNGSIHFCSPALQSLILNVEKGNVTTRMGIKEETLIRDEYSHSTLKSEVAFFCYLLIDPSVLSERFTDVTFRQFISSVFYIGKGKRSRPLQHLINARSSRKNKFTQRSEKLKRILDLWDRGIGVISLNVFTNIHSGEAFIREGSMIDAIGLSNLANLQRGTFPGVAGNWTRQQISEYGAFLLQRTHIIFQNERCRPIFEDISGYVY